MGSGCCWEISKENFMDDQKIFNFLKLKGSIGVLGNFNTLGNDYPAYPGLGIQTHSLVEVR